MQRLRLTLIGPVAVAATAIACTGAPAPTEQSAGAPTVFLAHIVQLLAANRYAEAWVSLNPSQQLTAPLPAYVACEGQRPIPGRLTSLRILRVRHEPVRVVPEQAPVASTAVTFALRIAGTPAPQGVRVVLTAHAVLAGAQWTWIMPPARLQLYRRGCGTAPPLQPRGAVL